MDVVRRNPEQDTGLVGVPVFVGIEVLPGHPVDLLTGTIGGRLHNVAVHAYLAVRVLAIEYRDGDPRVTPEVGRPATPLGAVDHDMALVVHVDPYRGRMRR